MSTTTRWRVRLGRASGGESLTTLFQGVVENVLSGQREEAFLDLAQTPSRVARMWRDELLSSYQPGALSALKKRMTVFPVRRKGGTAEDTLPSMVMQTGIPFASVCAHHMLPFVGVAHVGYVPSETLIGLSKFARILGYFSRKFQVQERLGEEVADFLVDLLNPAGLIVYIEARHLCMELRGVCKPGTYTKTSALRGVAWEGPVRSEFYRMVGTPKP